MTSRVSRRAAALGIALIADRLLPEPPNRWHPVAWFGSAMTTVEKRLWQDSRQAGVVYAGLGVAAGLGAGALIRSAPVGLTISIAASQLRDVAASIAVHLDGDDLPAARETLPSLVGRDPRELDGSGVAAAVIESVAENNVDAVIAPMFWTLVAGAPGALGYRAINTMDAMVGHRSDRYENFGWAAARLDDVANWVPARIFALLIAASRPRQRQAIAQALRSDAPAHPSPNAGVAEAAVAAALGVELGGPLRYGERVENRPTLGTGPRPTSADVGGAIRLTDKAQGVFAIAAVIGSVLVRRRRLR